MVEIRRCGIADCLVPRILASSIRKSSYLLSSPTFTPSQYQALLTLSSPFQNTVSAAWMVAATFVPVSFGWAAGDVSLAAYIQALLQREESNYDDVSPLGAVMAFLYSTYIIIYAVMSPLLGRYIDSVSARNNRDIHDAVFNIAGVQFTVLAVVIIASTFIPQGSWAFNPKAISGDTLTDARWSDEHVNRPPTSEDGFIDTDGDAKPVRGRRS